MFRVSFAAALAILAASPSGAGNIGIACSQSDRGAGQARLCACIQKVAEKTLNKSDQRKVAGFFTDPEKAQRARLSDSRRDEAFWERYERFGATAQAYCSRRS